ncbi:unnamed protein product, partial [Tenebrio molitor]
LVLSLLLAISAAETWKGPFADHKLGQVVEDTPEVAAAKLRHIETLEAIRAALPELPVEAEDHIAQAPRTLIVPEVAPVRPVESTTAQTAWTGPYADHKLGQNVEDTAEVAAARKLHSEVYAKEAVNSLEPSTTTVAPPVRPLVHWGQVPADTPEVAAAKLEHARAFAAALGH